MTSITWTMVAPTPKTVTAMTVASRKPSRRPMATMPRMPIARLAKPTSSWKGLLVGQPMDSATESEMKKCPKNPPIPLPATPTPNRYSKKISNFEATWVRRAAAGAGSASTLDWLGVQTPAELEQWSEGHGLDVFLPALLDSNDLRFYGTGSADGAGFALNRSGGVVGVSNVFAGSADLVTVWSDLIVVAASMYPRFNLVGYELGADLQAALIAGFAGIGPLRVWMR